MRMIADMETVQKFSRNVRLRRHQLNLSQEELAERIGCHVNHIGRIERGQADPSLSMIVRISRALELTPIDLLVDIS